MTCLRLLTRAIGSAGDWQMTPTLANGQPAAIASYRGQPYGLGVLTVTASGIARIIVFGGGAATLDRYTRTAPNDSKWM